MDRKPLLRTYRSADRIHLVDSDDRIVASGIIEQAERLEEIARNESRCRAWGAEILWLLGFTPSNPDIKEN